MVASSSVLSSPAFCKRSENSPPNRRDKKWGSTELANQCLEISASSNFRHFLDKNQGTGTCWKNETILEAYMVSNTNLRYPKICQSRTLESVQVWNLTSQNWWYCYIVKLKSWIGKKRWISGFHPWIGLELRFKEKKGGIFANKIGGWKKLNWRNQRMKRDVNHKKNREMAYNNSEIEMTIVEDVTIKNEKMKPQEWEEEHESGMNMIHHDTILPNCQSVAG